MLLVVLWLTTAGFAIAAGNGFHRVSVAVEQSMVESVNRHLLDSTAAYGIVTMLLLACACVMTTVFVMRSSSER